MPQDEQPRRDLEQDREVPAPEQASGTDPTGQSPNATPGGSTPQAPAPASPANEQGPTGPGSTETPPSHTRSRPPPAPSGVPRGTHIAWVRLDRPAGASDPATRTQPAPGSDARSAPPQTSTTQQPPPDPPRPGEHPPPGPAGTPPPTPTSTPTPAAAQRPHDPSGDPGIVERPGHDKRSGKATPTPVAQLRDGAVPSALGRLLAIIVTVGLGWALLVAIGLWFVVFLISRIA